MSAPNKESQLDLKVYIEDINISTLKYNVGNVRNILLCNVARIGDTLLTTPAIRLLAMTFPNAKIDFLGHPKRFQLLENLPYLNKISSISKKTAVFLGWFSLIKAKINKKKKYDFAVVWGHDHQIVDFAVRVSEKVITWQTNAQNKNLNNVYSVPIFNNQKITLARWQLALVEKALAIKAVDEYVEYFPTPAEVNFAKNVFSVLSPNVKNINIGLVLETFKANNYRNWPIEFYVELCRRLISENKNIKFYILGEKISQGKTAILINALGKNIEDLSDKFNLRQSAAILSQLDLYVGPDTGPSHIVCALGVRGVMLFHCVRSGEYVVSPKFPERIEIVNHPNKQSSVNTPMAEITVEMVYSAVKKQLADDK